MIRRALDRFYRREHRPPVTSPRCGLCGKAWPRPTERVFIGTHRALVCTDHLTGGQS